jgi:hypothetical protein
MKVSVKEPQVSEKSIQGEIRTLLELAGWRVHWIEVFKNAKVQYEDGQETMRKFSEGTAGQADLIAVRPHRYRSWDKAEGHQLFEALYIECKRRGKKSRKNQVIWQEVTRRDGFIVLSDCRSWADVVNQARANGVEVERG